MTSVSSPVVATSWRSSRDARPFASAPCRWASASSCTRSHQVACRSQACPKDALDLLAARQGSRSLAALCCCIFECLQHAGDLTWGAACHGKIERMTPEPEPCLFPHRFAQAVPMLSARHLKHAPHGCVQPRLPARVCESWCIVSELRTFNCSCTASSAWKVSRDPATVGLDDCFPALRPIQAVNTNPNDQLAPLRSARSGPRER